MFFFFLDPQNSLFLRRHHVGLFHSPASIHPPGHKNGGNGNRGAGFAHGGFPHLWFWLATGMFRRSYFEQKDSFLWPVVRRFSSGWWRKNGEPTMLICIHRLRRLVNAGLFTHIFLIHWCRISAINSCLAADGKQSVKTHTWCAEKGEKLT